MIFNQNVSGGGSGSMTTYFVQINGHQSWPFVYRPRYAEGDTVQIYAGAGGSVGVSNYHTSDLYCSVSSGSNGIAEFSMPAFDVVVTNATSHEPT